jgi:hypothetical protein
VTIETGRREELGLTQPDAAAQAEVSLETWQRWEDDPTSVSPDEREKCEHFLHMREARTELADRATAFDEAWGDCPYLTPRQASAIVTAFALWSYAIQEWLEGRSAQPLHDVGPFGSLDRRAMMYVNDNKAWAAKAQERCDALCDEIEGGVLPFDRDGCFFDELLIGAVLPEAERIVTALPEMFEDIPARAKLDDSDGVEIWMYEDDWDAVGEAFDDFYRWEDCKIPLYRDHPLLPDLLAGLHPFAWFDSPQRTGGAGPDDSE